MEQKQATRLADYVARPSAEELRNTHILFHAQHANDSSVERRKRFGHPVIGHASILRAIHEVGYRVTPRSTMRDLFEAIDYNFLFSMNLHHFFEGHELLYAALAAYRRMPYLGASAPIRGIAEDKVLGKHVAASVGLDVAEHRAVDPSHPEEVATSLKGRWVIKPRGGTDSVAVSVVESEAGWREAFAQLVKLKKEGITFIAEPFVPGLNLAVPVVEGFPAESFRVFEERGRPGDNVLDLGGKLGRTQHYISEPYSGPGAAAASAAAARMATVISPFDYARFDFRYDPEADRLVFLEVNIVCAIWPGTVVARAAEIEGIDFPSLIGHVITHSLRRQRMTP